MMIRKYFQKKPVVFAVMLLGSASVAWASCGETAILVSQKAMQMTTSLLSSITSMEASVTTTDTQQTGNLLGAIKVLTAQVKATSDAMAAATIQAGNAQATAISEIASSELKAKVNEDFVESQGGLPCTDTQTTRQMALTERAVQAGLGARVLREIQSVGHYGNVAAVTSQRQREHESKFCTQTEVDAGACSRLGTVPGGDQNASLLFTSDITPDVVAAKNAYINNVLGVPDAPINPAMANTPDANAYVQAKKQKDAFLGFAAYSLKSIQADSEQFNPLMNERVGQYFGTAAAEQWAANQASQSTRGVLVDLVKMQGINLKIQERRLKQSLRMEANLAALLELEMKQNGGVAAASDLANRAAGAQRVVH